MSAYQVIKIIVAVGIVAGGADLLMDCRFHIGEKMKEGFGMAGPMMLSIAGIMSLAPLIAKLLQPALVPVFRFIGADPAVFGFLLGCVLGGYQLAMSLAESKEIARMVGLATASMLGGTLTFSIPVGQAMVEPEDMPYFSRGMLLGIAAIPFGSIMGGAFMGIPWNLILINHVPVILLSLVLTWGFRFCPGRLVRCVEAFGNMISKLGIVGIAIGSISYLTGVTIIGDFTPVMESMAVVCGMTIVLIGMLPVLEIFIRLLKKPLNIIGRKIGLDAVSTSGIIFTMASGVPTFAMMKNMSRRGIVINAAWSVTCAAIFGSQLSFVLGVEPEMIMSFMAAKLAAGILALIIAFLTTRNMEEIREREV